MAFWHSFGDIFTIAMVMLISLPAAIIAGEYQKEMNSGMHDFLSTLVVVSTADSVMAWLLCGAVLSIFTAIPCVAVLWLMVEHSDLLIVTISLVACGLALAPIAVLLGYVVKKADAVVVLTPIAAFVLMLPGLLYFDIAFDIQRSFMTEVMLCLLPPSGLALVLRQLSALESVNWGLTWDYPADISRTPVKSYVLMLVIESIVYSLIAIITLDWIRGEKRHSRHYSFVRSRFYESSEAIRFPHVRGLLGSIGLGLCGCVLATVHLFADLILCFFRCKCLSVPEDSLTAAHSPVRSSGYMNHRVVEEECVFEAHNISPQDSEDVEMTRPVPVTATYSNLSVNDPTPLMRVEGLHKSYTCQGNRVEVLSNISTELHYNNITCLLGSNGAGKSTLMRILAGFDTDYTGQVSIKLSNTLAKTGRKSARSGWIGWCSQSDVLFEQLSVLENMMIVDLLINPWSISSGFRALWTLLFLSPTELASLTPKHIVKELKEVELFSHQFKTVNALSGGMKRRLCFLLAFAGTTTTWFCASVLYFVYRGTTLRTVG